MARFTKGKTFTSTEQVTSAKLHQLIDDAAIAIDTFNIIWPVGSVYTSVLSTNPNTLFGFGTWTAFGAGRTLVGLDAGQTEFDTVEETGGAKTHALTTAELATHTHVFNGTGSATSAGSHSHTIAEATGTGGSATGVLTSSNTTATNTETTTTEPNHTHTITVSGTNDNAGSGTAHNNLQPYIVVYFWKRTA
jgi:microcystin-dependent protein